MKRLLKILVFLAIGGYLAICAGMYLFQDFLIFHPVKLDPQYSFDFPEPFEEFWLDGKEGAEINALLFKAPASRGVVLYLHGTGGSIREAAGVRTDFLEKGLDFLILDYRTFGKSSGKMSEEGLYRDAMAAYELLEELYPPSRIVIYGRSLGSGIAAELAEKVKAAALVLETPYYSMDKSAATHYPWVPTGWLLKYHMNTASHLPKIHFPILVMHGKLDQTIHFTDVQQLVAENPKVQFAVFETGTHNTLNRFPQYHSVLSQFLQFLTP